MTPGLENSKVAAFGCSYGASLATWLRYKFPHLVDAAWASSGPLQAELDFYQYYEVAGEMYANVSSECIAIIRQGYREAKKVLSTPEGLEENRDVFQNWTCGNVTEMTADDILAYIRAVVSDQYNTPKHDVESCKFLQSKNATTSCFQQLAAFVVNKSEDVCFEDEESNDLNWKYQTCTEFGFSFTTTSLNQPFRDTYPAIDIDLESCAEDFGEGLTRKVLQRSIDRINRVYGATNLQVTRVLSVHGTHDPWHRLGLYQEKNKDSPVLLIPGTSHCADMSKLESEPESFQLTEGKRKGMEIMEHWLK
ncbi:hypothetical protein ILUMI_24162 [Ignelater luminosus]|uniref:Thymus-specific serine protease n=1 Tax=Ignelater luminosus TaxID=2038154 RepID=A0A8K0G188_IGNLU|nr:hypothetical protein ILUMI_24162 [Ignelater luminosus]